MAVGRLVIAALLAATWPRSATDRLAPRLRRRRPRTSGHAGAGPGLRRERAASAAPGRSSDETQSRAGVSGGVGASLGSGEPLTPGPEPDRPWSAAAAVPCTHRTGAARPASPDPAAP